MTALDEIKKTNHPDRIWATVNGMSTRLPDGARQLVGGWSQDAARAGSAEYVLASTLEILQRENDKLRQFLFPYADRTDISGISWDGKYLIGDKASITAFHEMKNRGEQIDVYKRAYDENMAALKARAEAAEAEVKRYREALIAAKTRMRNCRGAIESDQVVDKDMHGSLQNGIRDIQEALASTGGEHHAE